MRAHSEDSQEKNKKNFNNFLGTTEQNVLQGEDSRKIKETESNESWM